MSTVTRFTPSKVSAAVDKMAQPFQPQRAPETAAITVRLPVEVGQLFEEIAEKQGTNRSAIIRQAILEYLERLQPDATPA